MPSLSHPPEDQTLRACSSGFGSENQHPRASLNHPKSQDLYVALGATIQCMAAPAERTARTFKTAWFAKAARKAQIPDKDLCSAIAQVQLGQADDLGGGVYKKRLRSNQYRSIFLAKFGDFWIYEYLFARQDRANIDNDELVEFRRLAKLYGRLTSPHVQQLLDNRDWMEICHDNPA